MKTLINPTEFNDKSLANFATFQCADPTFHEIQTFDPDYIRGMSVSTQSPVPDRSISYSTGIYRINLVRKFATKKPIRVLNPLARH
jgi:hypothetical protein